MEEITMRRRARLSPWLLVLSMLPVLVTGSVMAEEKEERHGGGTVCKSGVQMLRETYGVQCGVYGRFETRATTGSRATTSVNVPPRSIQNCH